MSRGYEETVFKWRERESASFNEALLSSKIRNLLRDDVEERIVCVRALSPGAADFPETAAGRLVRPAAADPKPRQILHCCV
ncbi:unnamed protein product [Larinioides sclopetarius]|uniref:Uncharacterized protein n=1 Tax=Larinioides sclopetarius TaxID=280406 RepID=A0AAV2AX08_9ARAC